MQGALLLFFVGMSCDTCMQGNDTYDLCCIVYDYGNNKKKTHVRGCTLRITLISILIHTRILLHICAFYLALIPPSYTSYAVTQRHPVS